MIQKGIDKNHIISAAISIVEESGYAGFSMHRLAVRLGVRTASLYNHIESLAEVNAGIARHAVAALRHTMDESTQGISDPKLALKRLAAAYRRYAHQNPALYEVIIGLQMIDGKQLKTIGEGIISPIISILGALIDNKPERLHCARAFRSMLHGFVSLEACGYFESAEANVDDSFTCMINSFVDGLPSQSQGATELL